MIFLIVLSVTLVNTCKTFNFVILEVSPFITMGWCGALDGAPTWAHLTFSPCLLETVSSSLLVFVAVLVLVFQCRKISLLRQRNYLGETQWTRQAIVSAICFGILILSHLAVLVITSILLESSGTAAPYNIFSECTLFIVWLAALVRPSSSFRMLGNSLTRSILQVHLEDGTPSWGGRLA